MFMLLVSVFPGKAPWRPWTYLITLPFSDGHHVALLSGTMAVIASCEEVWEQAFFSFVKGTT